MKLGKKPFVSDDRDLKMSRYLTGELPTIPNTIFNSQFVKDGFQMFGNDIAGDCVVAGSYNMTKVWNGMNNRSFVATTENALSIYTKATGYNKNDPSTDNGTSMRDFLKLWRTEGITDQRGVVHKIAAFVRLDSDVQQLFAAMYLFGGVFAGFLFPSSAMRQFNTNAVWTVERDEPRPKTGHCVPIIDKSGELLSGATWGRNQFIALDWYRKYNDEAYAVLSEEMLSDEGCHIAGFNLDELKKDLLLVQN